MAKDFAKVNVDIWDDPDYLALPPAAQWLYLLLWTSPGLSYCGVHDWRPGRLAARAGGVDAEFIDKVSQCLQARHFLVVDEGTEEVLVRSWARFDGVMRQPKLAISFINARVEVSSQTLRSVLVQEAKKIREEEPDLTCWKDKRVLQMLAHPAVSAKDLPVPADPFDQGLGEGLGLGLPQGLVQTQGRVSTAVSTPPTTATTTTTSNKKTLGRAKREQQRRPDDWKPNEQHSDFAAEKGLDLQGEAEQFMDYHDAKGSKFQDWDASFRTWLRNAAKWNRDNAAQASVRRLPHVDELETPPDGLSEAEYSVWMRDQVARRKARQ